MVFYTSFYGEDMTQAQVNLEQTLSIWWSMMWRVMLVGTLVGAVLGGIGGFIVGFAGFPELGGAVGALMGWLSSIPVSIWALKAALGKQHGGWSIRLIQ